MPELLSEFGPNVNKKIVKIVCNQIWIINFFVIIIYSQVALGIIFTDWKKAPNLAHSLFNALETKLEGVPSDPIIRGGA